MKYIKYLAKAALHWLCVYIGLIAIVWFLFALLAVKMDGSYMWTEVDACAIKALAIILSYYVTRNVVEAYSVAASIVCCEDCRHLAPFDGVDPQKADEYTRIGACYCGKKIMTGTLVVRAGEYCIHGKRRKHHEKSRR